MIFFVCHPAPRGPQFHGIVLYDHPHRGLLWLAEYGYVIVCPD